MCGGCGVPAFRVGFANFWFSCVRHCDTPLICLPFFWSGTKFVWHVCVCRLERCACSSAYKARKNDSTLICGVTNKSINQNIFNGCRSSDDGHADIQRLRFTYTKWKTRIPNNARRQQWMGQENGFCSQWIGINEEKKNPNWNESTAIVFIANFIHSSVSLAAPAETVIISVCFWIGCSRVSFGIRQMNSRSDRINSIRNYYGYFFSYHFVAWASRFCFFLSFIRRYYFIVD